MYQWQYIEFLEGANPYICKTEKEFFRIYCKYQLVNISGNFWRCDGLRPDYKEPSEYQRNKHYLREQAIQWQAEFDNHNYSTLELICYQNYFERMSKRYGLIKEFRENGII